MKEKILIEASAIEVLQRPPELLAEQDFLKEYDFFIFSLSSETLLRIAKFLSRKDSPVGIQRIHKEDRDKEIGQFITSEHPFFPNTVIINIPLTFKDEYFDNKSKRLRFEIEEESAYVIDGQHRLKAFSSRYSKGVKLNLVVAAYFGLELPTIAEVFTRINYYQKPVSKSLVYDLLDFNIDPEFIKYREAHEIVTTLNSTIGSPFYGLVKMLGIGTGLISQAAFVEALTTRYRILDILKNKYSKDDKIKIISNYFHAVAKSFPSKWANEKSLLSRSVGFNSLIKIFKILLEANIREPDLRHIDYHKYTEAMRAVDVDSEDIKVYGGFKGVNALADKFITNLRKANSL